MPRKNDILPLTVESVGLNGEGIARLDGQVVFVAGGLPGEVCDTLLLKEAQAAAEDLLARDPDLATCPAAAERVAALFAQNAGAMN